MGGGGSCCFGGRCSGFGLGWGTTEVAILLLGSVGVGGGVFLWWWGRRRRRRRRWCFVGGCHNCVVDCEL